MDYDPPPALIRDRLSVAADLPLNATSLVGSFFHSDPEHGWQGCVVAEPAPAVFLVQLFSWMGGHPTLQKLVRIADMGGWSFYDHDEEMNAAYEASCAGPRNAEWPPEPVADVEKLGF